MLFKRVLRKVFQRSRIQYYKEIIQLALKNGYLVTSLSDWFENDFYPGKKVLILRHDVDLLPSTAYKLFKIEKELGVQSTFYFRWLTVDTEIIKTIKNCGFEVSLHYETLATYCKKNKIFSSEKLSQNDYLNCVEILKTEIKEFELKFGKIKTLCSHGDKRNRAIGIPNHKLLDNVNREEMGIYFETYDKAILDKIDVYISDSSINDNHKWKYGKTPEEAIEGGDRCICLLTHPHHWHYQFKTNIFRILLEIKDNLL